MNAVWAIDTSDGRTHRVTEAVILADPARWTPVESEVERLETLFLLGRDVDSYRLNELRALIA